MRTAYRVWSGIAAATFVLVAVVDIGNMSNRSAEPASASSSYTPSSSYPGGSTYGSSGSSAYGSSGSYGYGGSVASAPSAAAESVSVTHVIDGDTFEISSGRTIRVLGIDSCEANTSGGQDATALAQQQLGSVGSSVTLTKEPGVETDPYGRELRYVQVSGADFGQSMIVYPHTGVYEGENDAAPSYVASLRSSDGGVRTCDAPPTTTTPTPAPSYTEDDDDLYVPYDSDSSSGSSSYSDSDEDSSSSNSGSNTGDSGHPCMGGERDGDGDGWCGET